MDTVCLAIFCRPSDRTGWQCTPIALPALLVCLLATFGKADSAEPCAVLTCLACLHTDYACSNDTLRAPCAVHQPQQIGQHSPQITYEDIMSLLASGASPTGVMYHHVRITTPLLSRVACLGFPCRSLAPSLP